MCTWNMSKHFLKFCSSTHMKILELLFFFLLLRGKMHAFSDWQGLFFFVFLFFVPMTWHTSAFWKSANVIAGMKVATLHYWEKCVQLYNTGFSTLLSCMLIGLDSWSILTFSHWVTRVTMTIDIFTVFWMVAQLDMHNPSRALYWCHAF